MAGKKIIRFAQTLLELGIWWLAVLQYHRNKFGYLDNLDEFEHSAHKKVVETLKDVKALESFPQGLYRRCNVVMKYRKGEKLPAKGSITRRREKRKQCTCRDPVAVVLEKPNEITRRGIYGNSWNGANPGQMKRA